MDVQHLAMCFSFCGEKEKELYMAKAEHVEITSHFLPAFIDYSCTSATGVV